MNNGCDKIIEYSEAVKVVKEKGWDGWLEYLNQLFPNKEFYSVSQWWYEDKKYICKAKGKRGDVVIGWVGIH